MLKGQKLYNEILIALDGWSPLKVTGAEFKEIEDLFDSYGTEFAGSDWQLLILDSQSNLSLTACLACFADSEECDESLPAVANACKFINEISGLDVRPINLIVSSHLMIKFLIATPKDVDCVANISKRYALIEERKASSVRSGRLLTWQIADGQRISVTICAFGNTVITLLQD